MTTAHQVSTKRAQTDLEASQGSLLPSTHRAACVSAPGKITVAQEPVPTPGAHEVLVRVAGCGICGSDVPVWQGDGGADFPLPPGAPGHEAWGEIVAVGEDIDRGLTGCWVAGLCGAGYAEHVLMAANQIVAIPEQVRRIHPVLPLEPLACAMNAFKRSSVAPGDEVAVVGIGFIGAAMTAMAHATGARVTAISRRPTSLEVARAAGADRLVRFESADNNGKDVVADLVAGLDGDGFDCVVEATGRQAPLELAGSLCRTRGRLVIAGYHQNGRRSIDLRFWNWRGLDVINAHERDPAIYLDGMRAAIRALEAGLIPLEKMVTHQYGLDGLQQAFDDAARRPEGFLKGVVTP